MLVQINAADSHSAILNTRKIGPFIEQVSPSLWAFNADPKECLKEYVVSKIHSAAVYKLLFNNSIAQSFLEFLPSLDQLTMLGKIWSHSLEEENGQLRFERIIIDCPATGHGLQLLKVAQNTHDAVKVGPIAHEALRMAERLKDKKHCAVNIVTWPEELPINEAIEFAQTLNDEKIAEPGILFANGARERLAATLFSQLGKISNHSTYPSIDEVLRCRIKLEERQAQQLARIKQVDISMPMAKIEHVAGGSLSGEAISRLLLAFSRHIHEGRGHEKD